MHYNIFPCEGPGIRLGGLSLIQQMLIPADPMGGGGGGGNGCRRPKSRRAIAMSVALVMSYSVALSLLASSILPAQSVIMPPHKSLYERSHNASTATSSQQATRLAGSPVSNLVKLAEDVPYLLTITQEDSVSVAVNSKSNITVNLNRAVPEAVSVLVSVNSGPNLITFDDAPKTPNSTQYTEYTLTYPANTFGDRVIKFHTNTKAGHAEIVCHVIQKPSNGTHNSSSTITIDDSQAFISVNIYRNWNLNVIIQIVGWIYFFAWSISFYFQVVLNYQRKSVVGLNFDFLVLNLLGFACYSIYNFSLLFSHTVQQEYYKRHTYSRIPVEYNDLFFALHAFAITLVTVAQCFIYERANQHISLPAGLFVSLASALGFILFLVGAFLQALSILDVVLYLSYVKLVITIIKYSPQAYMNYKRQATTGWSIHNIMLDFTGGSFSILQMLLIAYNYDDWISIFGNATKFGLGLFSMAFDILFFIQHYVLYGSQQQLVGGAGGGRGSDNDLENSSDSVPSPIISQSIRSANNQQAAAATNANTGTPNESGEETD